MNRTAWLLLPILLLFTGCADDRREPGPGEVALLAGEPVTLEQFQDYLDESLTTEDEPDPAVSATDPLELDQVRSRLFDVFIDERLLAGEARRRFGSGPDAFDRLYEELAEQAGEPDRGEVDRIVAQRSAELRTDRALVLRALMFQDPELANRVHDQVRSKRISFLEAVAAHESTPGQGAPMETTLGSLPDQVRTAVAGLSVGQVSVPVEVHGIIYLFLVEDWRDAAGPADDELLREEARAEVRSRMIQDATGRLLQELRRSGDVRIETGRLPFRYVPEREVQVE